MNIFVPFICLAAGVAVNWRGLPQSVLKWTDKITNFALVVLMWVIGLNIGVSDTVMNNIGSIGLNCLIISFLSICCSVAFCVVCEKTVMPLEKIRLQVGGLNLTDNTAEVQDEEEVRNKQRMSPLVFVMPSFIAAGILLGFLVFDEIDRKWIALALNISLIFLYTGVGISLSSNKNVFGYIKKLGVRILFLPVCVMCGCIMGGVISALIIDVPMSWTILSATGMGYYSLTGAFMTESVGIEAGVYGFIVNVSRDVFTVLLMPILSRISKGSPIVSGAGGCMDTMLVPVTKALGSELGLVALISGTIITLVVPLWLPLGIKLLF